jgi:nicotinamidase-related amidase
LNTAFLDTLANFDLIYVAGQARSHCVLETIRSIVRYFADRSQIIARLRILNDCTSSIPGFEAPTEAAYESFAASGAQRITSADPLG